MGIETAGNPDSKFQFGGKEKQEEFGLNWNDHGARYYDPQLGRWHATDPLADMALDWSPYRAFYNNPISYTDETGLLEDECPTCPPPGSSNVGDTHEWGGSTFVYTSASGWTTTLSGVTVTGNNSSSQAFIEGPVFTVGSATATETAVVTEAAAAGSAATALAASAGIASLATLQGDSSPDYHYIHLGYIENYGSLGHSIVGLEVSHKGSKSLTWYDQQRVSRDSDDAVFAPVHPRMLSFYAGQGLRTAHKSISSVQYQSANAAIIKQMVRGPRLYHKYSNNCVTNVRPILSAAGYAPPNRFEAPQQIQTWFEAWHFPWNSGN